MTAWTAVWLAFSVLCGAAPLPLEFHTRTWTTDDGLSHNSVSSILQDSSGFMWFATVGGLARFDGIQFREFRAPAEFRSFGFNIRSIAEERPGTLLVLPAGDTILQLLGTEWKAHPVNEVLINAQEAPAAIIVGAKGDVWVSTVNGRLIRWRAGAAPKVYGTEKRLAQNYRELSLFPHASGGMWISGDSLWFVDTTGDLHEVSALPEGPGVLGRGRNETVWLLHGKRLRLLGDGAVIRETTLPSEMALSSVRHLLEDSTGAVWIASSRQGVFRFWGSRLSRVGSLSTASYLWQDREGNIWIATDGSGVAQVREKASRLLNTASGLLQEIVSSIAEDPTGRVWIANRSGGIFFLNQEGVLESSGITGTRRFANVICAANDHVWFGGGRNGLFRWKPGTDQLEQMPKPTSNLHVLFRARNGDLWFAADSEGIGYYRGDTFQLLEDASSSVRTIAEDAAGGIWYSGRNGGLKRWDGVAVSHFGERQGFPRGPVHSIYADGEERLWIGTAGGLVLKQKDTFTVLGISNGLADDIIEDVIRDHLGNLWFASRRGVFHVAVEELLRAAADPGFTVVSHRLGSNEGLAGLTPTSNYRPTLLRTKDGLLVFATTQGALMIDPERIPRNLPKLPVLIDDVLLDGTSISRTDPLRFRSGKHRLEFRFAALSYVAPEVVALRHQLEGVDQAWIDTSPDRSASYTNLPPGQYRLRVIARSSTGDWNTEGATLDFDVMPAWWETLFFRIAVVVFSIGLVALVVRAFAQRRLRHRLAVLEQQHALEKERSRIARDLHDELGAGLTEVGLLADRLVDTVPQQMAAQLSGLAWRTRRLATDLSGIVWTMNARDASLDQFASFLGRYATRLFRSTQIRCAVRGIEGIPAIPIPPDVQHHLLAAVKEALNNVMKHARASDARLELRFDKGHFQVAISDNGVGCMVQSAEAADGNGLRNMRTRVGELGGTFEITSSPGSGTLVSFRVPFASK